MWALMELCHLSGDMLNHAYFAAFLIISKVNTRYRRSSGFVLSRQNNRSILLDFYFVLGESVSE